MRHLLLSLTLMMSPLSALPLGNPTQVLKPQRFSVGYYGDYLSEALLTEKVRHQYGSTGIEFVVNYAQRLDLFAVISTTRSYLKPYDFRDTRVTETYANGFFRGDSAYNAPSYGIGFRGALLSLKGLTLGLQGQYFTLKSKVRFYKRTWENPEPPFGVYPLGFQVAQVGTALSYTIGKFFTPYIGIKWQSVRYDFSKVPPAHFISPNFTFTDLTNVDPLTYTIGMGLINHEQWSCDVEGALINETGIAANVQYRF